MNSNTTESDDQRLQRLVRWAAATANLNVSKVGSKRRQSTMPHSLSIPDRNTAMIRGSSIFGVIIAAVIVLPLMPSGAQAWGPNGHRIVAQIGENHLSPTARAAARDLAGSKSLALMATWPDFIRSNPDWDCVKPWHFLTVNDDETVKEGMDRVARLSKHCDKKVFQQLSMPNNVVSAIEYFSDIVRGDADKATAFAELLEKNGVKPPYDSDSIRLTALILVVHFVGDVHQPLHVGRELDRGGNSITTEWFGELTNLHTVWDSELIDKEGLSYSEFATFLEDEFVDQEATNCGENPATWAKESVSYRKQVYDIGDARNPAANLSSLSYEYAAAQDALLKQRLYLGGRRLGHLLNSIFDGDQERETRD